MDRRILRHHRGPAHKAGSAWRTCSSPSGSFSLFFSFSVRFAGCHGQRSSRSGQHRLLPPSFQKLHFDSRWSGLTTCSFPPQVFLHTGRHAHILFAACKYCLASLPGAWLLRTHPNLFVPVPSNHVCCLTSEHRAPVSRLLPGVAHQDRRDRCIRAHPLGPNTAPPLEYHVAAEEEAPQQRRRQVRRVRAPPQALQV